MFLEPTVPVGPAQRQPEPGDGCHQEGQQPPQDGGAQHREQRQRDQRRGAEHDPGKAAQRQRAVRPQRQLGRGPPVRFGPAIRHQGPPRRGHGCPERCGYLAADGRGIQSRKPGRRRAGIVDHGLHVARRGHRVLGQHRSGGQEQLRPFALRSSRPASAGGTESRMRSHASLVRACRSVTTVTPAGGLPDRPVRLAIHKFLGARPPRSSSAAAIARPSIPVPLTMPTQRRTAVTAGLSRRRPQA